MTSIRGQIVINRPVSEVFDVLADARNEPSYNRRMLRVEKTSQPVPSESAPGSDVGPNVGSHRVHDHGDHRLRPADAAHPDHPITGDRHARSVDLPARSCRHGRAVFVGTAASRRNAAARADRRLPRRTDGAARMGWPEALSKGASASRRFVRPSPLEDFGHVLTELAGVGAVQRALVSHELTDQGRALT
jgi:hypothetical protein